MTISKKTILNQILTMSFMFFAYTSNGQFAVIPFTAPPGAGLRTAAVNQVISIGFVPGVDGPALNLIRSRLHVNSFFMPPSTAITPVPAGNLFRTDGTNTLDNIWQLFTGAAAATTTEKLRLFVPANTPNIFFNAFQNNGNIQFQTNAITRLFINNNIGGTAGFVGIGNNFTTPGFRLHVKENINLETTAANNQGYRINNNLALYIPQVQPTCLFVGNTGFSGNGAANSTWVGFNAATTTGGGNRTTGVGAEVGMVDLGAGGSYFGYRAGMSNIFGDFNTFVGFQAAMIEDNGGFNVAVGAYSAPNLTNGANNLFLGANTDSPLGGLSNGSAIGASAVVMNNNQMILGNNNINVGIGLSGIGAGPGNKLEINTGVANTSGLRFRQLNSGSPPTPNPGSGVLALSTLGDLIYVPGPAGTGNTCGGTPNPLTINHENRLGNFQYHFPGQSVIQQFPGLQQNMVAIGYVCGNPLPVAKLNILEQQTAGPVPFDNYGGYFVNANSGGVTATWGAITAGVFGQARTVTNPSTQEPINAGGVFEGYNSPYSIGVMGRIVKGSKPSIFSTTGGYAIGGAFMSDTSFTNPFGPSTNYGVYCRARKGPANIGIYAEASPTGTNGPNYAGYFNGDVVRTGNDNFSSDQILKQNIDTITNALGIINQLQPKTFTYKTSVYPQMSLPSGPQFGLIAQQVQTVVPALVNNAVHPEVVLENVNYPAVSYLTLEYQQLIPIVIRALQQADRKIVKLDSTVQAQNSVIQNLTNSINACCENQQARPTGINNNDKNAVKNQLNVDLSDKDVIVLDQNIPNPYAEQCIITYNVPEQYKFAQIIFKTVDGKIIKAVDIEKKGRGQLNVFANDLSNGLYTYTLIVDGKIIDTKKMVKQN